MVLKLTYSLMVLILACLCAGCANKRIYFGMDDYGVTSTHETAWKTEGEEYRGRK